MRITQGTFSFLPDLTDEQIAAQVRYALSNGWALGVEHTDDPHPRNLYWDIWGQPLFDLADDEDDVVLREVRECREAFPTEYVKLIAYDSSRGRQTTRLSFIVNRPSHESGFAIDRTDDHDRVIRYRLRRETLPGPTGSPRPDGEHGAAAERTQGPAVEQRAGEEA